MDTRMMTVSGLALWTIAPSLALANQTATLATVGAGLTALASFDDDDHDTDDTLVLYGVDSHTSSLIRCHFDESSYDVVGPLELDNGSELQNVESLAYIPGRLHLYAIWNDLDGHDAKLVTVDMFDAQATSFSTDIGFGNVEGLVAAWGPFGEFNDDDTDTNHDASGTININPSNSADNQFELTLPDGSMITRDDLHSGFGGYEGSAVLVHVKPKGNGNNNSLTVDGEPYPLQNGTVYDIASESMTVTVYNDKNKNGKAMGHWWIDINAEDATISVDGDDGSEGDNNNSSSGDDDSDTWALFGVATDNDGQSSLIRVDPDSGSGAMVMSLSQRYEGLAFANNDEDATCFYAIASNMLWCIDVAAGTESIVGEGSFAGIQALEFALSTQDDMEGTLLFGFSDQDDALVNVDQATGVTTPYDSPVNGLSLEGIVLLNCDIDPKDCFSRIAFD